MAVDEALMLSHYSAPGKSLPVFRFYRWKPACFSMGYFQKPLKELKFYLLEEEKIHFVRRLTGGSIIYHDDELTYSISCFDNEIPFQGTVKESFRFLSSFILNAYRKLDLNCAFAVDKELHTPARRTHLCFASREEFDIVIDNKKIGGNAQKRKKHFIFQHGSIPFTINFDFLNYIQDADYTTAWRAGALQDFLPAINYQKLKDVLAESFRETMNVDLVEEGLTEKELHLATKLENEKYRNGSWNLHK